MKNSNTGFAHILVLILVVIGIGVLGYYTWNIKIIKPKPINNISLPSNSTQDNTGEAEASQTSCNANYILLRDNENKTLCFSRESLMNIDNWKIFKSKFNYTISYPENSISSEENYDFQQCLWGNFPTGGCVVVEILNNPNNLPLDELGNRRYATDAPEPYDLKWKDTTLNGEKAITTRYTPPGDSGPMVIYLINKKGTIFSILTSHVDQEQDESKFFEEITNKILSTFKYID